MCVHSNKYMPSYFVFLHANENRWGQLASPILWKICINIFQKLDKYVLIFVQISICHDSLIFCMQMKIDGGCPTLWNVNLPQN